MVHLLSLSYSEALSITPDNPLYVGPQSVQHCISSAKLQAHLTYNQPNFHLPLISSCNQAFACLLGLLAWALLAQDTTYMLCHQCNVIIKGFMYRLPRAAPRAWKAAGSVVTKTALARPPGPATASSCGPLHSLTQSAAASAG